MKHTVFGTWLARQHQRDDPVGDLARDFRRCRMECGHDLKTAGALRMHMQFHGAMRAALTALDRAQREWWAQASPTHLDFQCPTCRAEPGDECWYGSRSRHPDGMSAHAKRLDLAIRASRKLQASEMIRRLAEQDQLALTEGN